MATHSLPQPDHVGSAVIRYVSLGLPGFGSFEWDEPRGLAWLAGWLVYGDIGDINQIDYIRQSAGQSNGIRPLVQVTSPGDTT